MHYRKGVIPICDICRNIPCIPRCPNAPEPRPIFICSGCGEDILEGDLYWDIMGEQFCDSCIDEARKEAVYYGDE